MGTIVIDPVTRIEGHLKVEVNVNNGYVTGAKASGTMARGIEQLLLARDPRDATYVTERICGVCFSAHGWTSSLAVEKAQGTTEVPEAARILRNLIAAAAWLHDHILQFYQLAAPDYLDLSVLTGYTGSDPDILKLKKLIISETGLPPVEGQYAGPFLPAYAPDTFHVRDMDAVVKLMRHYLDALLIQVKAKKMSALFGGKQPHQSGIVAGGVTQVPDQAARNEFQSLLNELRSFVENFYIKDVQELAHGPLWNLAVSPVGVGKQNYLSYGGFPLKQNDFLFPAGAVIDGQLVTSSRTVMEQDISEDVTRGWYTATGAGHPALSRQEFDLNKSNAYTFIKAPRYRGVPMEVGPLARMLVILKQPHHPAAQHPATLTFAALLGNGMQPGAVARHLARALETQILLDGMQKELNDLNALINSGSRVDIHDTAHWDPPSQGQGWGMTEAPRGALGHWIRIEGGKIANYACVVPTTWNAAPQDAAGVPGPIEQAIIGCPVPDETNPVNVARIIRSFDPCIACAVHVLQPAGDMKRFAVG